MREFYRRHRGLHRWLLAVVALLAVYFALRPVPGLMNWLSRHVIMPWERPASAICSAPLWQRWHISCCYRWLSSM